MFTVDQAALIAKQEGVRYFVYDDATGEAIVPGYTVKGYPTIGEGRNLATTGVSGPEIGMLLADDWGRITAQLDALPWFKNLDPNRAFVVLDMTFQMGLRSVLGFASMIEALEAGNYADAAASMLASKWAKQTPTRAQFLASAMASGRMSKPVPSFV
jgi:lysozyme